MSGASETYLDRFGRFLARRLESSSSGYEPYTPSDPDTLRRTLEPGDILLVEGNQKISAAIKYLTQSTWSHSALYVGDLLPQPEDGSERPRLIEVNLGEGCVAVPLSIMGTFAVMAAMSFSLDNLSLMALTVVIGIVVDDAIVMI